VEILTQGERVKEIRKHFGLTLEKFGEKIGMKKNSISQIENGVNALSEQVAKAICREFNVDYIWLTTGGGNMFTEDDDQEFYARIDQLMDGESESRRNLFKSMLYASDEELDAIQHMLERYAALERGEDPGGDS
jgi:transcriptional regulator with XRE-family HTH domain